MCFLYRGFLCYIGKISRPASASKTCLRTGWLLLRLRLLHLFCLSSPVYSLLLLLVVVDLGVPEEGL